MFNFHTHFLGLNNLPPSACAAWIIRPGMEFGANAAWWGGRKPRKNPHEGIDLCLFRNSAGAIRSIGYRHLIPSVCDGVVAALVADFMGTSVFVKSGRRRADGKTLYLLYGHLRPSSGIAPGCAITGGEPVGSVSDAALKADGPTPHLHVSTAFLHDGFPPDMLNWRELAEGGAEFVDPIDFLEMPILFDRM